MPLMRKRAKPDPEMSAGPQQPLKPSNLAIAYSAQRQAKKKKYAKGGFVRGGHMDIREPHSPEPYPTNGGDPTRRTMSENIPPYHMDSVRGVDKEQPHSYAEGGPVLDEEEEDEVAAPAAAAAPIPPVEPLGKSSSHGASTGGVGSGLGGAGTGGAATGGASTGGAGTVNVTISGKGGSKKKSKDEGGSEDPTHINISGVGGTTDAGNVASGDGPGALGKGGNKGKPGEKDEAPAKFAKGGPVRRTSYGDVVPNEIEKEVAARGTRQMKMSDGGMVYDGHMDEQKPHSPEPYPTKGGDPNRRTMSEATPPRITDQEGMPYKGYMDEKRSRNPDREGHSNDLHMPTEFEPYTMNKTRGIDQEKPHSRNYADGGMVEDDEPAPTTIAEAIRRRERIKTEGQADLDLNSEEAPNYYDPTDAAAANRPQYDVEQISPQPEDSNEHGDDDMDRDQHNIISKIRAKYSSRRKS